MAALFDNVDPRMYTLVVNKASNKMKDASDDMKVRSFLYELVRGAPDQLEWLIRVLTVARALSPESFNGDFAWREIESSTKILHGASEKRAHLK